MTMRKPWSREPCSVCGNDGYATRTVGNDASVAYVCGECEMYERGYRDGCPDNVYVVNEWVAGLVHRAGAFLSNADADVWIRNQKNDHTYTVEMLKLNK